MIEERRNLVILIGFWLVIGVVMTMLSWNAIEARRFPDPDDVMRMLEVRDWVGGQSWFDVTQHRLNAPAGAPMHWSRLVDIPLAAVVLLTSPLLGPQGSETAAMIVVPLLTLGIVMLLVMRIGLKLMSANAALVAAIATPFSLGALKQMRPMRVDHHGWQIVAALVAILAALDDRQRRSGVVAGLAMALWMNISIEGLPFAAAVGALFAWRWLKDAGQFERLRSYLASLALFSVLAFAAVHAPSTWLGQPRDVVTPAHLAAFALAAIVASLLVRPDSQHWQTRGAILALVGGSSLAAIFAVDPHWLTGPFGSLPPLVKVMWYSTINEGLPVWQVDWSEAAMALAQPIVGIIGASLAWRRTSAGERERWETYLFLLVSISLASAYVIRTGTTASIVALPATAYLFQAAWRRARSLSVVPLRAVATTAALAVMTPAYAVPLTLSPANQKLDTAFKAWNDCTSRSEVEHLNALPISTIAAPLEITPAILFNTPHRSFASGHHRNAAAMNDVIELFLYSPEEGARILERRPADYIAICPGAPESIRYAHRGPDGLIDLLRRGKEPGWLEPVEVPGLRHLKIWRVRKDLIASDAGA